LISNLIDVFSRSLHEQTVTSLAGLQSEMTHIRRDLAEAQARQGELSGLQAEVTGLREERHRLRSNVSQADQQRDAFVVSIKIK
jgi:seryl-tRNA synthetase